MESDESPVSIGRSLGGSGAFLADMQTRRGGDPSTVRYTIGSPILVHVDEEVSADPDLAHTFETIGWIVAPVGSHEID